VPGLERIHGSEDAAPAVGELVRQLAGELTGAEKKVARVLLAAYPIAGLETIAELSERAEVSAPSVIRFVKKLGFDSYPDFQRALREEIQARISSPLSLYERRPQGRDGDGVLGSSSRTFVEALEATFRNLPATEFEAVVDRLAGARGRVLCTGGRFSQVLAYYLLAHLRMLRPGAAFIGEEASTRSDELMDLSRRDTVVVFDYRRYQNDTVNFARMAAQRRAIVILFTDPWLSPAADVADYILTSSVEAPSPFDSLVAGMGLVEAVVAGLFLRMGDEVKVRIEELEQLRTGLTWSPDVNARGDGGDVAH
jgi:DNA-binding MurR/RpiR family transcriptional regulator